MYAWIWRKLPFGLPGKIVGSLALTASVVALLWFVVFPWIEPLFPFDDVQVGGESGVPGDFAPVEAPSQSPETDGSTPPGDEHDLPYSTESNNPVPTRSR